MFSTSQTDRGAAFAQYHISDRGWSVAARLTLWYAASALALLLGVAVTLDWVLSSTLDGEISGLAQSERSELADIFRQNPVDLGELREEVLRGGSSENGIRLWMRVLDAGGTPLFESPQMTEDGLDHALFPPAFVAADSWDFGRLVVLPSGVPVRTFAAGMDSTRASADFVEGAGRTGPLFVEVAVDCTTTTRILRQFRQHLAEVTGVGYLMLVLVGYAIASKGLEPVRSIAQTMRRIGSTTLHERVDRKGLSGELWILATAFNDVLERLDASFLRLAQFSADIAHELRTPLARMRLAAEIELQKKREDRHDREALADCLEEAVKLSRLIDRLLFLARAEGPQALPRHDFVDLFETLETVAEFYRAPAEEACIDLVVDAERGIVASVDRELLLQAIGNLVQNSLAYTAAGGEIRLGARTVGDYVEVVVRDSGCGIPAEHFPQLFDAFHRVDRARSTASGGTGLGLAIVKKIARLHGGDVKVESEVGSGTVMTLVFPRSSASALAV